ncbi:hypothetical protein [Verminephrobacter eiseniae]|uniref:hypothetical protein n=1 Tax=Verminephrobacter eiseniae TaxID=364317 RepID=UPI0022374B4E|nr:hypothetical protein [Verminephrobacter eiseniae]MCW5235029.1 hypothetical protein [Verminephrobacter eiseniae]
MNHAPGSRTPQQGQALLEFLVIAAAILGLFLLTPVIAKYQDIAHATHMASRYAAFDATVHNDASGAFKPEGQLAGEVRERYFGNPDAPIESAAVDDAAGGAQARRNPFWSTPHGAPLIRDLADVSVTFGAGQASSHHQAFSSSSDGKPFSQAPLVNHATLGLQARGIYRANISVPLVDLPEGLQSYTPFDEIDLRITRHTSVLIDPWAARSVQQNMERFGKLVPLDSGLSPMETLLDAAIPAFELFGEVPAPRFGRLQPWQDVVPADRLKPEY